jgi:hypothetical protein
MAYNNYNSSLQRDPGEETRQQRRQQARHESFGGNEGTSAGPSQLPLTFPEYDAQSPTGIGPSTYSNQIQFQVPFMLGDLPTIPPGGGAEAMTAMLPSPASSMSTPSWFVNDFMRFSPWALSISENYYNA